MDNKQILFEWSKEFSVKNMQIDAQHKKIFDIANEAWLIAKDIPTQPSSKEQQKLKQIILHLLDYINTHFKEEEIFMQNINFPLLKEHKQSHRELIEKVKNILKNISDTQILSKELALLTKKWILKHIIGEDMLIKHYAETALDIKEIHYSLEQYNKILAMNKDIEKESQYSYVCSCMLKTHKICQTLHEHLLKENSFIRCKVCKQPLVYLENKDLNEKALKNFKLKFFGTSNV
ncbi:hemerythrin family protein [Campylobacter sp. CCS1377]|uniref:Hemerythrin family protein n=1 Tax=Campylobacter sp. CCS1377 TaxID=3158229 RepID=A0AAU7E926_9BACT|nr:hemerythrin family protein [Campylobacter jejuni]